MHAMVGGVYQAEVSAKSQLSGWCDQVDILLLEPSSLRFYGVPMTIGLLTRAPAYIYIYSLNILGEFLLYSPYIVPILYSDDKLISNV
jgi:hypothetical protein